MLWFILLLAALYAVTSRLTRSLHWSLCVAFFYTCARALWFFTTTSQNRYGGLAALDQMAISNRAGQTFGALVLMMIWLAICEKRPSIQQRDAVESFLRGLVGVYATLVLLHFCFPSWSILALLGAHVNASHMASLVAAMGPVVLFRPGQFEKGRPFYLVVMVLILALSGSALAPAVVAVTWVAYIGALMRSRKLRLDLLQGSVFVVGLILLFCPQIDNGRFEIWGRMLGYWFKEAPLLGSGPGSFLLFGPQIQHAQNFMTGSWFVFMHNDWLQILFELGAVGFVLWAVAFGYICSASLKQGKRGAHLFSSLLGLAAMSFFNYPLHQPESVFFGFHLIALILGAREER